MTIIEFAEVMLLLGFVSCLLLVGSHRFDFLAGWRSASRLGAAISATGLCLCAVALSEAAQLAVTLLVVGFTLHFTSGPTP